MLSSMTLEQDNEQKSTLETWTHVCKVADRDLPSPLCHRLAQWPWDK